MSASGDPLLVHRLVSSAASDNATLVKAGQGRVKHIQGYNAAASARYLKLYNKATAPAVGTDAPLKTIAIPAGAAFALDWPDGIYFGLGIGYGLVTAAADNSTAAVSSADIVGLNIDYN